MDKEIYKLYMLVLRDRWELKQINNEIVLMFGDEDPFIYGKFVIKESIIWI